MKRRKFGEKFTRYVNKENKSLIHLASYSVKVLLE